MMLNDFAVCKRLNLFLQARSTEYDGQGVSANHRPRIPTDKHFTQTLVLIVEGRRHHVYIEFESDSEQLLHPPKKLFCQVFGRVCLGYTQT